MVSIGINLSSNRIYIAVLSNKGKRIFVNKLIMEELPEGLITKGEVIDILLVAENLKNIWRKYRLPGKKLHLGISNQKTIVKEVEIPLVDDNEIKNSLKYQISEYIPITKDNLIYDFFVTERTDTVSKIIIVGAMKSMIQSFVEVMKFSGLISQSIDLNAFALYRSHEYIFKKSKKDDKGSKTALALDIGESISNIGILDLEKIKFPRVTAISLERFVESLSPIVEKDNTFCRELIENYDFKNNIKDILKKSSAKNKAKKENKADKKEVEKKITEMDQKDLIKDDRIISIFQENADDLINEVNISIEHFNQDSHANNVNEILLSGQGLKNINKYFESKIGLKTRRIGINDLFSEKELKRYAKQSLEDIEKNFDLPAIGMALRGLS